MKNKKGIILAGLMTIVSAIYIYLVKCFDVAPIGPAYSKVGLSTMNSGFKKIIGVHINIYDITEILGYLIFILVAIYGLIGLVQLIKRKSILKVDREIISVGILYVLMILVYVLFEKVIVNYRPVLIDKQLEASFPSSHTVLAICTCISSLMIAKKYIPKKFLTLTNVITIVLLLGVFIGRTISGVHWLSDIIGGIIISTTLLTYFSLILDYKK